MIERIKRLHSPLQTGALGDLGVLKDRHVPDVESRCADAVAARGGDGADVSCDEARRGIGGHVADRECRIASCGVGVADAGGAGGSVTQDVVHSRACQAGTVGVQDSAISRGVKIPVGVAA